MELDDWSPNGHNGKYKETAYFDCEEGRGLFVRHDQIISTVDPLNPLPLSALQKSITMASSGASDVAIGDEVRLKNGLVGSVRFKGNVDFADDEYLGIELDNEHYNGGNGDVNGREYFSIKRGHGYFAKYTDIANVLTESGAQMLQLLKKMQPLREYPNRGDRVKTIKGETGTVRYVGTTIFAPKSGMLIGMELTHRKLFDGMILIIVNVQGLNSLNGGPMGMMALSKGIDIFNVRLGGDILLDYPIWLRIWVPQKKNIPSQRYVFAQFNLCRIDLFILTNGDVVCLVLIYSMWTTQDCHSFLFVFR